MPHNISSVTEDYLTAVFKAEEWDDHGLMVVDSALIYAIVDVLLGGRRGTSARGTSRATRRIIWSPRQ